MAAPAHPCPAATVVVITLDRGPAIAETIESLLRQEAPPGGFEILLVDNASKPENAAVLRDFAEREPQRIRYVREAEVGESAARNCAVRHARGAVHVHIDDDAVADPGWLLAMCAPFADPQVGGVGGFIRLRFEEPPPDWVDESLTPFLSVFDAGPTSRDLHYPDYPRGANMALRACVHETAGVFSTAYGRKGPSLLSYCETEMFWRVERAGFRVVYAPEARVDHIVPARRLDRRWFTERIHWQGRSMAKFECEHLGRWRVLRGVPRQLAKWLLRPAPHRARHAGWLLGAAGGLFGR